MVEWAVLVRRIETKTTKQSLHSQEDGFARNNK